MTLISLIYQKDQVNQFNLQGTAGHNLRSIAKLNKQFVMPA
jgi:hypothetical protein